MQNQEENYNLLKFINVAFPLGKPCAANSHLTAQLRLLYEHGDGFLAFESALHIYSKDGPFSLHEMNAINWSERYQMSDKFFFFGQDVFAHQYAIHTTNDSIIKLDIETGEQTMLANGIDDFFAIILNDFEYETGWPLARQWQIKNRPLELGERLQPKIPFVLGGAFDVENLFVQNMHSTINFFADFYNQTKDLKDGDQICFEIFDN